MKPCPFCAEEIQDAATVCKHCGKDVGPGHKAAVLGKNLQSLGCALTLLITVPIVLLVLMSAMC